MTTSNQPFTSALDNGLRLGDIQAIVNSLINNNGLSTSYGIIATGTTQATATQLTSVINQVDTTPSGTGVNIPSSKGRITTPYKFCIVINNGANTLIVYPAAGTTDTINATTSVTLTSGNGALFASAKGGIWIQIASGGSTPALITAVSAAFTTPSGVLNNTFVLPRAVAGTTDTIAAGDAITGVKYGNASAVAVTLPAATSAGFTSGFSLPIWNTGAGSVTITPTTSTINGAATLVIPQNAAAIIYSDGTNYLLDLTGSSNLVYFYPNNDNTSVKLGNGAAGGATTTTNGFSVVIGYNAGLNMGAGQQVVYIGKESGFNANGGTNNVGVGYRALFSCTGQFNTSLGQQALQNVTGNTNTAIGALAGVSLTTGQSNTFLGSGASQTTCTTGQNNIIVASGGAIDTPASGTNFYLNIGRAIIVDMIKPTIGSGFGVGASVVSGTSNFAFTVNVGTGGTASTGVIQFTNAAPNGWVTTVTNRTTTSSTVFLTKGTTNSATSITLTNYAAAGTAAAWNASDILEVSCTGF